jgi:hypothetical protein
MSIQSKPYFWVTCDWEDCEANAQEDSEFSAWADQSGAIEDAQNSGWLAVVSEDGSERYYCNNHQHWSSDENEMLPGPPEEGDSDV